MRYAVIDMKATGANIKALREQRGLSVRQLQTALCLAEPQAIYRWQRGETLPEHSNLVMLSKVLGVTVDQILVLEQDLPRKECGE